jgi:hypothetical protein
MPRFLVESYVAVSPEAFERACERARRTAEVGEGIAYVHSTYLPGDETVLHLFEAPSQEVLGDAAGKAELQFERIVEAVEQSAAGRKESET